MNREYRVWNMNEYDRDRESIDISSINKETECDKVEIKERCYRNLNLDEWNKRDHNYNLKGKIYTSIKIEKPRHHLRKRRRKSSDQWTASERCLNNSLKWFKFHDRC